MSDMEIYQERDGQVDTRSAQKVLSALIFGQAAMRRVSIIGTLVGGLTDIASSTIFAIPLLIYVTARYGVHGHAAVRLIFSNGWLYALEFATGLAGSVLGGYVAATIAKHNELLNGFLSCIVCTAIGVYSVVEGKSPSISAQLLSFGSAPVFALLGGYLRYMHKHNVVSNV
jgi:hypothetical protein